MSDLDGRLLKEDRAGNRRRGYREVVGTLRGHASCGAAISLASYSESALPATIQFVAPLGHYIVDERQKLLRSLAADTDWCWREEPLATYEVSELTPVYQNILQRGACLLTPYAEAAAMHQALIKVYNQVFFGSDANEDQACPVT